ncbi:MAG: hypothetical protein JSW73_02210 [Candidatus Woesearchaeota archaeon]|nr:MAG: hypothetical protein JSW73_02210 [Candidatus Woesearchaeota archaeon]
MKVKLILILVIIIFAISSVFIYIRFNQDKYNLPAGIAELRQGLKTGDYSYCDEAKDYRYRCIAEIELEKKLEVEYNCCSADNCNRPECFKYIACGSGSSSLAGCPIEEYCAVDQIWLCEATGGVSNVSTNESQYLYSEHVPRGFCNCSDSRQFIQNYGCADCDSFEHEETREYCRKSNWGYFRKYCDY